MTSMDPGVGDHSSMALRLGQIRELYNLDSQPRWPI